MPLTSKPTYFPALTGLRAVAAFSVFLFHHGQMPLPHLPLGLEHWLRALLGELYAGVSIFFTLSGFLITYRYAGRRFDRPLWRRYLLHRAARIWPVYLVLVLATFALLYPTEGRATPRQYLTELLTSLTLLKGFVEDLHLTGIAQSWSLTVEECFYALAPLLLGLGARYGPGRSWPLLALGLLGLGMAFYKLVPGLGYPLFVARGTIFGRLLEFLVGAAFAWALRRWPAGAAPAAGGRATALGAAGVALALGLLVVVRTVTTARVAILTWPGVAVNNLLLPLGTGLLLWGLCRERTRLSAALGSGPGQALGRASYCFYLLHMGVLADWLARTADAHLPGAASALAQLGLLVLASLALHRYLEQPAYRWLVR